MKIGVISDTHGYLDPKIPEILQGVHHILHAGDIGTAWIIFQLEQIAPVTAVLGNNDSELTLPETAWLELASQKFWVQHIVNPQALGEKLASGLARRKINVVVFGHTHKAFNEKMGDLLFLNPGYAGTPRLGLKRSLVIMDCQANAVEVRFVPL